MEVVDTKFCDWSVPELDLEPSYKKERKSELVNSSLVPVPENDVLMQVDSLVHLESENLDADFHESQCDLESTEDFSCHTKAMPLSGSQQVFLWLTKPSSVSKRKQSGLSMGSVRQLLSSLGKLNRRCSSESPSYCRDHHGCDLSNNDFGRKSSLKKCATDNSFTHRKSLSSSRSFGLKGSEKAFQTFQQISNHGNAILSKPLKAQTTAPGGLMSMLPAGEILTQFPGITPTNRLRSTSSILQCSTCSSSTSSYLNRSSSQMLHMIGSKKSKMFYQEDQECKICLCAFSMADMVTIDSCQCSFCQECLRHYVSLEIMAGQYDISCPDPGCPSLGVISHTQLEELTDKQLMEKHKNFRLNTEVHQDSERMWCPDPNCHTIISIQSQEVICPSCSGHFCSSCSYSWHGPQPCFKETAIPWAELEDRIKPCPVCLVPIERDEGCAQMMCRSCKHVFCWFCSTSLDGDFMLRHYDSGACRGKLGHSRSSVFWHRAQVVGFFTALGLLVLVASPLIIIAAPAVICCKCRSCLKRFKKEQEKNMEEIAVLKR